MSVNEISAGKLVPDEFNVIIEIPMNADPIKYELDKPSGALFVDRFMMTAMHYPANYGYVSLALFPRKTIRSMCWCIRRFQEQLPH